MLSAFTARNPSTHDASERAIRRIFSRNSRKKEEGDAKNTWTEEHKEATTMMGFPQLWKITIVIVSLHIQCRIAYSEGQRYRIP